ncbi:UNKNOWN [Stylonychia lemnae]|uniref:Transmembrane protein n=1 Tax=Stylonychia lemnae TaxID=5949 RepID=A0A078B5G3_STYLE|nr:UNKNOWN [Stylonychia lemnae]|eukprot:CDW89431.1 UNKNOWN [Stylonychia lemnae]
MSEIQSNSTNTTTNNGETEAVKIEWTFFIAIIAVVVGLVVLCFFCFKCCSVTICDIIVWIFCKEKFKQNALRQLQKGQQANKYIGEEQNKEVLTDEENTETKNNTQFTAQNNQTMPGISIENTFLNLDGRNKIMQNNLEFNNDQNNQPLEIQFTKAKIKKFFTSRGNKRQKKGPREINDLEQ